MLDHGTAEPRKVRLPDRAPVTDLCLLCLPPAAIPGYQHPVEGLSSHVTQFYINKIDAANKEQKLEDKGEGERSWCLEDCNIPEKFSIAFCRRATSTYRQRLSVLISAKVFCECIIDLSCGLFPEL